jgi:PAS domain S-box-containing protein
MFFQLSRTKETVHLWFAIGISLTLAAYSLSVQLLDVLRNFFEPYTSLPVAEFLSHALFLWLLALLWLAYRRWRQACEREKELETIVTSISPDVLMVVSPDRTITMCNANVKPMFGYEVQEVLSRKTDLLYFDRRTSGQKREIYNSLEMTGFHVGAATGKRKDGTTIHLELITAILRGRGGAVILIRDVSDRKRAEDERRSMEAQLLQTQKLESLGLLAGGIAHDFNNLLMSVLGNASMTLSEIPSDSPAVEAVQQVETAARRAAELANQLLAYSGRGKFIVQPLNLSHLVHEMTRLLEVSVSKRAALTYHLAPDLPAIEADATQMRQIVMNLITNASDAIGDNAGVVTVTTGILHCDRSCLLGADMDFSDLEEGDRVYLEVSDTGCGMDDSIKRKIFDPFFTTKLTGRGLGLAAVLGIARTHRGTIRIQSEKDKGTTFRVMFPKCDRPAPAAPDPRTRFHPESPWATGTVLLIDDEHMVRDVTCRMLESIGFTVIEAGGGREGIELFRKQPDQIRAVLLDMTMPDLSGRDTFRELTRIRGDIKVILSSGYSEEEATDQFGHRGLAGFVQKPYTVQLLAEVFRRAIANNPSAP